MKQFTDREKRLLDKIMNTSVREANSGIADITLEDLIDDKKLISKIDEFVKKKHGVTYDKLLDFIRKYESGDV